MTGQEDFFAKKTYGLTFRGSVDKTWHVCQCERDTFPFVIL